MLRDWGHRYTVSGLYVPQLVVSLRCELQSNAKRLGSTETFSCAVNNMMKVTASIASSMGNTSCLSCTSPCS